MSVERRDKSDIPRTHAAMEIIYMEVKAALIHPDKFKYLMKMRAYDGSSVCAGGIHILRLRFDARGHIPADGTSRGDPACCALSN